MVFLDPQQWGIRWAIMLDEATRKSYRKPVAVQLLLASPITTRMRTYVIELPLAPNYFSSRDLAFDKLDIQCWIDELVVSSRYGNITKLAQDLNVRAMMLYRLLKAA